MFGDWELTNMPRVSAEAHLAGYRRLCENISQRLSARWIPGVVHTQVQYLRCLDRKIRPGIRWLDLGCGRRPYPLWIKSPPREIIDRCALAVGCDVCRDSLKGNTDFKALVLCRDSLPFANDSFDLVTANMVVEHLDKPDRVFAEVKRVLRPGGHFVCHTVNRVSYYALAAKAIPPQLRSALASLVSGRKVADVFPVLYRANDRVAIAGLAEQCGFVRASVDLIPSTPACAVVPLMLPVETLAIRLALAPRYAHWRTNIIATLEA